MAHFAMIESWLLSSGLLLPQRIRALGHRYTLICESAQRYRHFALIGQTHPVMALARRVVELPTNDAAQLLPALEKLHAEDRFDGVITSCDYYLRAVALTAEQLGLPGAAPATVQVANSKHLMREAMRRAGLPGPLFATVKTWPEATTEAKRIGYRLIAKPVDLCASQLVRLVRDEAELERAFNEICALEHNARGQCRSPLVLLESFLSGPEVSVETVTFEGRTEVVGITDKSLVGFPYFVESGHMFPAPLAAGDAPAVAELAVQALTAVGYDHGVAHVEIKLTDAGPRVVEINTRVGGNWISELVRQVQERNPLDAMVSLALGQPWQQVAADTGVRSAAIQFLLPRRAGRIAGVDGWTELEHDDRIVDRQLRPDLAGRIVREPHDNDDYLGYVMCVDRDGHRARAMAESCIDSITLRYAEQPMQAEAPA